MNTKILKLNENSAVSEYEEAIKVIREGGLVAFPTETVYGLGGDALSADASRKIYAAKGRPSDNPLIVHIASINQLEELVAGEVPASARRLADAFWPGPLTMILPKSEKVPYATTGGLETVAIRMPSHPVARTFLQESEVMIAAPSANTSGRPSPTLAEHVIEDLNGKIDVIIDGGEVGIGIESTIIDLSEEIPTVLRPGFITLSDLRTILPDTMLDPGLSEHKESNVRPKAPGMRYRHYAPKADLTIIEGEQEAVIDYINAKATEAEAAGKRVGIMASAETAKLYSAGEVHVIGSKSDEAEIARHLFAILREFDAAGVDVIYSESFASEGVGYAVMNRLLKAAGHHVEQV